LLLVALDGHDEKATVSKKTKKRAKVAYPGMMADGSEEQNSGQRGNPAHIGKERSGAAFGNRGRPK
jgi:FKBP-type peptidyl-prolyl cis-trans isomerase